MPKGQCEHCLYYEKENPSYGECHRYPPKKLFPENIKINLSMTIKSDDIDEPRWPFVCFDDWCGEFKSRATKTAGSW
ncbi:hypothetical protein [Desulfosarcina variabilis]|uniref:hypothetical protein n=1 Tax=Desulfosarcina variabilis TaxID=2300 RepID=UPI003AFA0852